MSKIISYCLYEGRNDIIDRSHDPSEKEKYRYWTNIPFFIIANHYYFPDYIMKVFCPEEIKNHPLYFLLEKLQEVFPYFKVELINRSYVGTEVSTWRLMSLWDDECDICFCRDTDSIMDPREARCMHQFQNSDFWITNIRGVYCHGLKSAVLMAGLCGFRPKLLKKGLPLPKSFDDYSRFCRINNPDGVWGSDQMNMVNFFFETRTDKISKKMLDFYVQPDYDKTWMKLFCKPTKKSEFYGFESLGEEDLQDIDLSYVNKDILNITSQINGWCGDPVDVRGKHLDCLLSLRLPECKRMRKIILASKELRAFYRV